ncbi:hypothetical protein RhiirA1_391219 [Rhizophagus irregularis]|uniref:Uncharacterized protein n=1 Tax=Rhizophagus irregularis TaxID=588596 RepID=A0A2N0S4V0_9GLOM|nr:hypothetical protein RhiirA1_391219 [Rhizophagus irregularis]
MSIVESGFGRLRFVDPPTKSDLKKMCDDDNTLKISMWIQNQCFLHVQEKILYVDEPFAINTLFNFFENNKELSDEILEIMSIVNNPSACAYPADVSIESFITNGRYELRKSSLCVKKRNKSKKVDEKDEDMGEADEEEKMGEDMGDRERVTNRKKDKSKPKRVKRWERVANRKKNKSKSKRPKSNYRSAKIIFLFLDF